MKPDKAVFDAVYKRACQVMAVGRDQVDWMIKRHYLGKWPGVCVAVYALLYNTEALGVAVFALPPRETCVRYGGPTWELARLWVHDSMPHNTETWFVAQCLKYIKKNHPQVSFVVSYADPSRGHTGNIYKAGNWSPDGMTDSERKTPRFDYADILTGKKYSRRSHVPVGAQIERIPRVSKYRFIYRLSTLESHP